MAKTNNILSFDIVSPECKAKAWADSIVFP